MSQDRTTLLIVGAGPAGLAVAISLAQCGFRDFIIVDPTTVRDETSRAMAIHAATLEALDSINCAEPLIERGIKGKGIKLSNRTSPMFDSDCSSLEPYTRFPYILFLPQKITEEVLEAQLKHLGIEVSRPEKAVGLETTDTGDLHVTFESGNRITARYVIGADGARSVVRQLAGIAFSDPDGDELPDERLAQMVLADVSFSSDSPHLPKDFASFASSGNTFFLVMPLPPSPDQPDHNYRIGFNVPLSKGPPPSRPAIDYLQHYLNAQGPIQLSSDDTVNPHPIHLSKMFWATRFRTHAAIADKFMARTPSRRDDTNQHRGTVLLIGDAAHIHSPAGGQGMNLSIRDAISLGPVLSAHITSTADSFLQNDKALEDFAANRRQKALATIRLTKRIMTIIGILSSNRFFDLGYLILRFLGMIPFVKRQVVWSISGLGNR